MADPAVNFYPENFLAGTMFMTNEQVGKYIRALCAQQINGHLPFEELVSIIGDEPKVKAKFVQDGDGLWYNVRMEREILKRKRFTQSRLSNLAGHSHMGTHMGKPHGDSMCATETETDLTTDLGDRGVGKGGKPKRKKRVFVPPSYDEFAEYCQDNGYSNIAKRAYNGYALNSWCDSTGKPVLSWKSKLQNVWFREENRDKAKPVIKSREQMIAEELAERAKDGG